MQTIKAAAIKIGDRVWTLDPPARHHDIIAVIVKDLSVETLPKNTQGFVTNLDFFVDRVTAAAIALESKQIETINNPPYLYTEDIW